MRHVTTADRAWRRTASSLPSTTFLAAVAVGVASGIAFAALSRQDEAPARASSSSGSTAVCESDDPLYVTADPAVVPTLSALAHDFADAFADEGRGCLRIEIDEMAARDVVAALQEGWGHRCGRDPT
jgi:hypothetical protein